MSLSAANANPTRIETFTSNRHAKSIGPLLGFFLASIFPNIAIAKLGHIKIEYDPVPLLPTIPAAIATYQKPVISSIPTWNPFTEPFEDFHLQATEKPHNLLENPVVYSEVLSNIESPSEYLIPSESQTNKVSVKRAISQRYSAAYRKNRYTARRKYPEYFEYDNNYDYFTTPRVRNRQRNQGRRPTGFDDDYDYDYDYGKPQKRKNQKRRNKYKNKKRPDYYSDEEFDDDIEPVTVVVRQRQQQTTTPPTTTDMTTMPATTNVVNGTTPSTTTTTTNTTAIGYGYGQYTGNENISITYGPTYESNKPVYGVPGTISGTPLSEWSPSYLHDTPSPHYSLHHNSYYSPSSYHSPGISYFSPSPVHHSPGGTSYNSPITSYGTPSITSYGSPSVTNGISSLSSSGLYSPSNSYGSPSITYGSPSSSNAAPSSSYGNPSTNNGVPSSYGAASLSYGVPSSSYGAPSSSYGAPGATYSAAKQPSTSYDVPSRSYGTPSAQGSNYQSYQLPISDNWYGKRASHSDMAREA